MNTLIHRIGERFPNNPIKDRLRRLVFPILFTPVGSRSVRIGPPNDKVSLRIAHFPLFQERLGEREIEGYMRRYTPQTGHIVVNAGGYHGYFALYLAIKVGSNGHVYCFEPDPINAAVIHRNMRLNDCQNITIIQKGLWSKNMRLPFETRGSSSRTTTNSTAGTALCCQLDDEMKTRGVDQLNFISMDIEGAEIEALAGARNIITQSPNVEIAIASYHIVGGKRTAERVENALASLGLQSHTEFPRHLTTYGFRG